ncbi:unnamed protein product [Ilex paraguariensis]|uniref:Uncharacterized protein n=1 Tax=Ilex paraguariensis TaxID=185542 RepID=A0ABC8RL21_9AQUA
MLNCIAAFNIHPRGHTAEIGYDTTQLLYAIGERGVYIDLPLYIFNHVLEASKNDSFMYPMNAMGMGTLNKSVGVILGAKRDKCVKQPSTVSQVMGSQADFAFGTSEVGQILQQMVEKFEARFEKFEDETKGSF